MKIPVPGKDYIHVARQNISDEDRRVLHDVVDHEQYAAGTHSKEFERNLATYFHVPKAHLVNSGSSALLVAMLAAKEQSGNRKYVITSALGFPTTAAVIYQAGFVPWFLDCDPETLQVPIGAVLECLKNKDVAGVILAHTLGFPYDAYKLNYEIKYKREDVFLIEDACDAWGAEYFSRCPAWQAWIKAGGGADMAAVSMYPAHQISAGEGGAVLVKNQDYDVAVRSLINWGRECICEPGQDNVCGKRLQGVREGLPAGYDHKYVYSRLGYNLKMTEFSAALGNSQLSRLDSFVEQRRINYTSICKALSKFNWMTTLPVKPPERSSPFGVPIFASKYVSPSKLIQYMEDNKIGTRRMFGGNLLRQPAFRYLQRHESANPISANAIMEQAFWIGCWPGWTDDMTQYVVHTLEKFEKENI